MILEMKCCVGQTSTCGLVQHEGPEEEMRGRETVRSAEGQDVGEGLLLTSPDRSEDGFPVSLLHVCVSD